MMAGRALITPANDPVRRARARAGRIREGIHNLVAVSMDIARAKLDEDWRHLGYESWADYVEGEFGAERMRLPREQRQDAVARLALEGFTVRDIAKAINSPPSTVQDDLKPPVRNRTDERRSLEPGLPQATTAEVAANTSSEPAEEVGVAVEAASGDTHLEKSPLVAAVKQRLADVATKVAADKALLGAIEDDAMRDHDYVTKFVHAVARVLKIAEFDADRIADLADEDQLLQLSTSLDSLTRFTEKVRRRRSGLRLVQGGAS